MAEEGAWCGLAETSTSPLPTLVHWRDTVLATALSRVPNIRSLQHYTAFNQSCTASVAIFDKPQPYEFCVTTEPGIGFTGFAADKKSEFRQPGCADPVGEAPILYSVIFKVPEHWHAEFNAWYDEEHMPMIFACKEWGMTRRYSLPPNKNNWTHLALHYVLDAKAFDSPALKAARLTTWRAKLLKESWFTNVDKMIYFKQTAETPAALQRAS